jgi:N-acetylglucosamine malate deacetylase 1
MTTRNHWRSLPVPQSVKQRVKRFQRIYWKYFRPLYCECIPTPPAARVLVVSPHIDDDVIGCGGVLRQHAMAGAAVTSVYLRNGGPIREAEAHEAGKLIGIDELIFLRWGAFPASGARWRTVPNTKSEVEVTERTMANLREVIERVKPDLVYTPFVLDPHPDHAAATYLLSAVADQGISIGACYLYEIWSPLVPNVLVDITAQAEMKRRAINAHRSQVETIDMSEGMLGLNTYRAHMNRMHGYAEAFLRLGSGELRGMLHDLDGQSGSDASA